MGSFIAVLLEGVTKNQKTYQELFDAEMEASRDIVIAGKIARKQIDMQTEYLAGIAKVALEQLDKQNAKA